MTDQFALLRYIVFGGFALAVLVAVGSWLVRTRRVSPFGGPGKLLRQLTDPVMKPIERRIVRRGGTPTQAGWWLVIGVAILGVIVVSLAQWLLGAWTRVSVASHGGARDLAILAVTIVYDVLFIAILVRVIGSWIGAFRYSGWMRPFYWLTDWLIKPIQRMMPATGMFDLSPLVALLVLWVAKQIVFSVLF